MSVLLHTEDLQKLCRICCQFLGKGSYCKEKHQENIEHIFLINTKNDNPSLHPDKICQKCYCVMSAAIKRKSTITTAAFKNWTEHCSALPHLWQNSTFPKRGTWNPKIWLQEKKQQQTKGRNKGLLMVTKFLWFPCSTNKINNTSYSDIKKSQQWRFKSPCFSLHMWNLLRNN